MYASSSSYYDLLIVKYDATRSLDWYIKIDLGVNNTYVGAHLDSKENLIIAGRYSSPFSLGNLNLAPGNEQSAFIAKIDKAGNPSWLRSIFDGYPTIHSISIGPYDNIYLAGESWYGGILSKLSPEGDMIWKWEINSPSGGNNVWGADIKEAPDGSSYGLLMFQSERINVTESLVLYNPYSWGVQMVLFKFTDEGEVIWYEQNEQGRLLHNPYIEVDQESSVYIAGNFNNAPLQLGNLELPTPMYNRVFGFLAKCTAGKEWEWLYQRDPFPNLSGKLKFDCQTNFLYAPGTRSLEVFKANGELESQLLFDEDYVRPLSIDIGPDNNILLAGASRLSSILGSELLDRFTPFIASFSYDHDILKLPAAPEVAEEKIYICPGTQNISLSATGENISWRRSSDLTTVISTNATLNIADPVSSIYYVSQEINGCESPRARIELIGLGEQTLEFIMDTLFAPQEEGFEYTWSYEGQEIPGATGYFLSVDTAGFYAVEITAFDCIYSLEYSVIASGTQHPAGAGIKIYPSPFEDYLEVAIDEIPGGTRILIYNLLGQKLMEAPIPLGGSGKARVNTMHLEPGTMLLSIETPNGVVSRKILKIP